MNTKRRLELVAAAVGLALGTATALAQSEQDRDPLEPRSQERAGAQDIPRQQESESDVQSQRQQSSSRDASRDAGVGSQQLDELAREHDELSTFVNALKSTGLANSLTGGTNYTVFAPTNDAFESMQGRSVEELTSDANREELISLLRAHIVADDVDEQMARRIQSAETVDGGNIALSTQGDTLMVGDATVEDEPVELGNLRVYRIDGVLSSNASASVARSQAGDASQGADAERGTAAGDERSAAQDREPAAQASSRESARSDENQSREREFGQAADAGQDDESGAGQRQAGAIGAGAERGSAGAEGSYPSFEEVDRNSDGQISRTELAMIEGLGFTTADRNQDGHLDRAEYQQATEE